MDAAVLTSSIGRLRSALTGHSSSPPPRVSGLEDVDCDDMASLERLREEATRACMKQCEDHLFDFLKDIARSSGPPPDYEEWIRALHPENASTAPDGVTVTLDKRFYVDRSDHRRLWNRVRPDRVVAARAPPPDDPTPRTPPTPPAVSPADADLAAQLARLEGLKRELLHLNALRQRQRQEIEIRDLRRQLEDQERKTHAQQQHQYQQQFYAQSRAPPAPYQQRQAFAEQHQARQRALAQQQALQTQAYAQQQHALAQQHARAQPAARAQQRRAYAPQPPLPPAQPQAYAQQPQNLPPPPPSSASAAADQLLGHWRSGGAMRRPEDGADPFAGL